MIKLDFIIMKTFWSLKDTVMEIKNKTEILDFLLAGDLERP